MMAGMTTAFDDLRERNPLEYHAHLQRLAMANVSRLKERLVRTSDAMARELISAELEAARIEVEGHRREVEKLRMRVPQLPA